MSDHRVPMPVRAVACGAIVCALPWAAVAQSLGTEVVVHFDHHPQAGCSDVSADVGAVEAACSVGNAVGDQSGVARAAVSGGHLAVFASADQSGGVGSATDVAVRARAVIQDRVLIYASPASGLAGQRASMTYTVHLSGILLNATTLTPQVAVPAGSVATSALDLTVNIAGLHSFVEEDLHRHYTDGIPGDLQTISSREATINGLPVDTVFGSHTFEAPFSFGQGFEIFIDLDVAAGVRGGPMSSAASIADSSHSFAWGGIEHITVEGREIDDYTMISSLGIDWTRSYAAPVPQPATAWLLGCGLAVMGIARHRRPRHRVDA